MTLPRSNVRAFSNVHIRMPVRVEDDVGFRGAARTRDIILRLHPELFGIGGVNTPLARDVLTAEQLKVVSDHFPCPVCNRWDRWPVSTAVGWKLSFTPLGCPCSRPAP